MGSWGGSDSVGTKTWGPRNVHWGIYLYQPPTSRNIFWTRIFHMPFPFWAPCDPIGKHMARCARWDLSLQSQCCPHPAGHRPNEGLRTTVHLRSVTKRKVSGQPMEGSWRAMDPITTLCPCPNHGFWQGFAKRYPGSNVITSSTFPIFGWLPGFANIDLWSLLGSRLPGVWWPLEITGSCLGSEKTGCGVPGGLTLAVPTDKELVAYRRDTERSFSCNCSTQPCWWSTEIWSETTKEVQGPCGQWVSESKWVTSYMFSIWHAVSNRVSRVRDGGSLAVVNASKPPSGSSHHDLLPQCHTTSKPHTSSSQARRKLPVISVWCCHKSSRKQTFMDGILNSLVSLTTHKMTTLGAPTTMWL